MLSWKWWKIKDDGYDFFNFSIFNPENQRIIHENVRNQNPPPRQRDYSYSSSDSLKDESDFRILKSDDDKVEEIYQKLVDKFKDYELDEEDTKKKIKRFHLRYGPIKKYIKLRIDLKTIPKKNP